MKLKRGAALYIHRHFITGMHLFENLAQNKLPILIFSPNKNNKAKYCHDPALYDLKIQSKIKAIDISMIFAVVLCLSQLFLVSSA